MSSSNSYLEAKCDTARVVAEAKTGVWEEFGEAMEKDLKVILYHPVSPEGKAVFCYHCFHWEWGVADIVGRCNYLLNLTEKAYAGEEETGYSGPHSLIIQPEVTDVVKNL